ncbi:MAG: glycosyltransferase family 9 protein [Elusimicrobia bacterium]|nr:glycosyltransferase family 9 protein [Elusimicrobiota bacterium]
MGALKDAAKSFERAGSAALRSLLRAVLPAPRPVPGPLDCAAVRRVLIVRQDSRLGNLLLLTPLLKAIREAFPSSRADILVSDAYGDILRGNPNLDGQFVLPKAMFWPDPSLPPRLFLELRGRRYDLAFDASAMHAFSLSSALITALCGAARTVGFDRGDARVFLNAPVPPPALPRHETSIQLGLLRHLVPGPDDAAKPECHLGGEERAEGRALWSSWGLDPDSVALFVGARAEKRWPLESFLGLAGRIGAAGRRCIIFAGPAEKALVEGLGLPAGAFLAPSLPLRRFAAALAQARAVVTADTGPMHLAVALGVPTVELFIGSAAWSSEPWRYGYVHLPGHRVIEAGSRDLPVDEVWSVLHNLVSGLNLSE